MEMQQLLHLKEKVTLYLPLSSYLKVNATSMTFSPFKSISSIFICQICFVNEN